MNFRIEPLVLKAFNEGAFNGQMPRSMLTALNQGSRERECRTMSCQSGHFRPHQCFRRVHAKPARAAIRRSIGCRLRCIACRNVSRFCFAREVLGFARKNGKTSDRALTVYGSLVLGCWVLPWGFLGLVKMVQVRVRVVGSVGLPGPRIAE